MPAQTGPGFEEELVQVFRETGEAFHPDHERLALGGAVRGRRLRRRRLAGTTGAALACTLVLTGGLVVLDRSQSGSGRTVGPAASGPAAREDRDLVTLLAERLPAGTVVRRSEGTSYGPGSVPVAYQRAELSIDDGHGAGQVQLTVSRRSGGGSDPGKIRCPQSDSPKEICTSVTRPDGSILVSAEIAPPDNDPLRSRTVSLLTPDGLVVVLDAANFADSQKQDITRPEPVLTLDQLQALALDPIWHEVPTSATQDGVTPSPGFGSTPMDQLLPSRLTRQSGGGTAADRTATLTDGTATVVVAVQLQRADDEVRKHFAAAPTLPDGTRMLTVEARAVPGSQGATETVVDLLRPDGRRVRAAATNPAGADSATAGREPLLTVDQLTSLAAGLIK
ncbi:hypothetical protein GCM10010441_00410 [Kitasatospora paracochleata]|uniref:LigA protein n=1 Tax=Kitasatospora paracochleata TaxID=58354 RepID=A0ABT1IWR5_9ACTN|nr:hypothetical protein [Kitasatospora paracochleata]MCP2309590.1 hypothetical protein [Kitasatospora paracochleata]